MMLLAGLIIEEHQEHQGLQECHGRHVEALSLLDSGSNIGWHLNNDGHCSARLRASFDQEPDHGNEKQEGIDQKGQESVFFHACPWTKAFLTLFSFHVQFGS